MRTRHEAGGALTRRLLRLNKSAFDCFLWSLTIKSAPYMHSAVAPTHRLLISGLTGRCVGGPLAHTMQCITQLRGLTVGVERPTNYFA